MPEKSSWRVVDDPKVFTSPASSCTRVSTLPDNPVDVVPLYWMSTLTVFSPSFTRLTKKLASFPFFVSKRALSTFT